ncbi:hypothetical protein [Enterobacter phage ZX14]
MKTVFCDEHKNKIFAVLEDRLDKNDLLNGTDIMIDNYFYRINASFIEIKNNEPQLLVIVHKVK